MALINEKMQYLGNVRSAIRDLYEYGLRRAKEVGRENVYDFSLGNPSVPAPDSVEEAIEALVHHADPVLLHGYTSASGALDVREAIASDIQKRFKSPVTADDLYVTCGAAASLCVALNALHTPGDEAVAIAPFFPEYRVFSESAGMKFKVVDPDLRGFQVNFDALREAVTFDTKAVIVNSPNNPTGVVLTRQTLVTVADILREKEQQYGHPVFLIADEPYRELVYDDIEVPYIPNLYDDTIVCYSYSKSLSIPGERIGYVAVPKNCSYHDAIVQAVAGAGRALGYVCAPSLMQRVVSLNLGRTADLSVYKTNRDLLYRELTEMGYEAVYPDGAFYLFVKSPDPDAKAFSERAKRRDLLIVPSDSFGCPGYLRIAYCVPTDTVRRALPVFQSLITNKGV